MIDLPAYCTKNGRSSEKGLTSETNGSYLVGLASALALCTGYEADLIPHLGPRSRSAWLPAVVFVILQFLTGPDVHGGSVGTGDLTKWRGGDTVTFKGKPLSAHPRHAIVYALWIRKIFAWHSMFIP